MDVKDAPPGAEGYQDTVVEVPKNADAEETACTKAEREFQEHLNSLKIRLENGELRCMVERRGRDISGKWIYLCYPCAAVCSGESILQTHISGKRHKCTLSQRMTWSPSIYDDHPFKQLQKTGSIAPNEKVLKKIATEVNVHKQTSALETKYENYREATCHIQHILDNIKTPLVGLEYLVEHPPEKEHHEPKYVCTLCMKNGQPRTIVNHLVCFWHRYNYLQRHFPTASERLNPYKGVVKYREGFNIVMNRLTQRIEDIFGRLRPVNIDKEIYDAEKEHILQWLCKGRHFNENPMLTLVEVVDVDLIQSVTPSLSTKNSGQKDTALDTLSDALSELSDDLEPKRRKPSDKSEKSSAREVRREGRLPDGRRLRIRASALRPHKVQIAQERRATAEESARSLLAYHTKNPEKHPLYAEEWRKFWNRRYKEIQAEGKDPSKHDFKPEWIVYWKKRMQELHDEELKITLLEICRLLNVSPSECDEPKDAPKQDKNYQKPKQWPPADRKRPGPRKRSPDPRRRSPEPRKRSPEPKRRSPEPRKRSPEPKRRSPVPRKRSPEPRRRSPEPRKRSPEHRRKSPEPNRRSPYPRRRSPDPKRRSPDPRRRSPEPRRRSSKHRSPDARTKSPDPKRRPSDPRSPHARSHDSRRRSPDLRRKSPDPRRRSPDPRRRSPDSRQESPDPRRRSPELKQKSPEHQRLMPHHTHRSPDLRQISPDPRRRSPDPRRRSSDPKHKSPESRHRSPDPRHRLSDHRLRSPDPRRRSPDPRHRSPEHRLRSPDLRHLSPNSIRRSPDLRLSPEFERPDLRINQRLMELRMSIERRSAELRHASSLRSRSRSPLSRVRSSSRTHVPPELTGRSRSPSPRAAAPRPAPPRPRHAAPSLQTVQVSDDELGPDDGLSPWNSDIDIDSVVSAAQSRSRASLRRRREPEPVVTFPMDAPENMVATLRVLVALEDFLGSLGPRVVDLLTEALRMEKERANSSEELLERDAAVALVETAKEKLKGAAQAGLVPAAAAPAVRAAVLRAAATLHAADERAKRRAAAAPAPAPAALPVAGVGAVDRAQIARQIAAALVAQGKTDVSAAELAQLVDAVVGAAEAKRRTAAPAPAPVPAPAPPRAIASTLQMLQSAYDENVKKAVTEAAPDVMDGLSDSDLETLLKNFNELSAEEQHNLITYLKKIEAKEPQRVERLRHYVGTAVSAPSPPKDKPLTPQVEREVIPTTRKPDRETSVPRPTRKNIKPVSIESDEEDYTDAEVMISATQKVKEDQTRHEMEIVKKSLETKEKEKATSKAPLESSKISSASGVLALVQASINSTAKPRAADGVAKSSKTRSFGDTSETALDSMSSKSLDSPRPASVTSHRDDRDDSMNRPQSRQSYENVQDDIYSQNSDDRSQGDRQSYKDRDDHGSPMKDREINEFDQGGSSYNSGSNQNDQGPNSGTDQRGQGLNSGPNQYDQSQGPNQIGHGSTSGPIQYDQGQDPNPPGQGPNRGQNQYDHGQGPNQISLESTSGPNQYDQGHTPNQFGQGPNCEPNQYNQGQGPNQIGLGSTSGPNQYTQSQGPNKYGQGPNPGQIPYVPGQGPNQYEQSLNSGPNQYDQGQGPNVYGQGSNTGSNQYNQGSYSGQNQYDQGFNSGPNQYAQVPNSGLNQYPDPNQYGQGPNSGPNQYDQSSHVGSNQYGPNTEPNQYNQEPYPGQSQYGQGPNWESNQYRQDPIWEPNQYGQGSSNSGLNPFGQGPNMGPNQFDQVSYSGPNQYDQGINQCGPGPNQGFNLAPNQYNQAPGGFGNGWQNNQQFGKNFRGRGGRKNARGRGRY